MSSENKREVMAETVKKATEYFGRGLYCSQAVLGAFCEKYGMDRETAFRISCGLNSGFRCAEVCGAATGAVLVIGLRYGDARSECNLKTEEFMQTFIEKNGSAVCRDLLDCDISTPDGRETAMQKNLYKTLCLDLVRSAAQILDDFGY